MAVRASPEGLSGPGPRAGQRGATRWSPWAWGGAFGGVPGPGPCGPGTRVRAEPSKEAPGAARGGGSSTPLSNACWQPAPPRIVLERGRKRVVLQPSSAITGAWRWPGWSPGPPPATRLSGSCGKGRARLRRAPGGPRADNEASLRPTRRGRQGRGVDHVRALGVEPITGKPYKPTTHGAGTSASTPPCCAGTGKQPPPRHRRRAPGHRPGALDRIHTTPSVPTRACPGALPPPRHGTPPRWPRPPDRRTTTRPPNRPDHPRPRAHAGRRSAPTATRRTTTGRNGTISLAGTAYLVSRSRAGQEALITWDAHRTTITDPHGKAHSPSTRGRNREPGTPPTTAPPHAPPQETAPARTPETSPMP